MVGGGLHKEDLLDKVVLLPQGDLQQVHLQQQLDKFQLNVFLQKRNFVFEKSERVCHLKTKEHEDEQLSLFSESFARETMSAWAVDKAEQ